MAVPGGLTQLAESVVAAAASVEPGSVVVALSGGPDSAVAAWACVEARPEGSVRAAFVDHGWEASPILRRAAGDIAVKLNLDLEVIEVDSRPGPSPEGAAREARLKALETTAHKAWIVTGHQADDSAETVLGNLLRGAGVTGLAGIPQGRDLYRRPLLPFRRAELRRLAEALELPFVDDPANEDLNMRRNLIRHEVIPQLQQHVEGDLVELLGRTARHLAATDSYLDSATPPLTVREEGGAFLVPVAPLLTEPPVLAARAVRTVLRKVHPPYAGPSREVGAVLSVARRQVLRADLSEGWIVEAEGPFVALYRPGDVPIPDAMALDAPGEVTFGDHVIAAERVADGRKLHMSTDRARIATAGGLVVRAPQPGDRIELEGGSKSVADALGEAAVPRRERSAWPVVESRARIAWIPGVRVAAWARQQSTNDIWLELERRRA